jgi:hypothetical protein
MRLSGSTSGMWKRSMAWIVRHRQTKEPGTDRPSLNHRATSRLYPLHRLFSTRRSVARLGETPANAKVRRNHGASRVDFFLRIVFSSEHSSVSA